MPARRTRPAFPRFNPAYPLLRGIRSAWFHLGDHKTFFDIIGGNHGAAAAGISRMVTPWGRGAQFTRSSSSSYYQLAKNCDIYATTKATIALSLFITGTSNADERSFIGTHGRGGDNKGYFFKYTGDDSGSLGFFLNESWSSATIYFHQPCTFISMGPTRMLMTIDGTATVAGINFYQDGKLLTTTRSIVADTLTTSANPVNGNVPWLGQQENAGTGSNIDGCEDALIFWDRVLSTEEIEYDALHPFGLVSGKRYPIFLVPAAPTTLTVSPSAIDSTAALGSATASYAGSQAISGTGIDSTVAFGSGTVSLGSQAISGTGIDSIVAFGSASVTRSAQPVVGTGIDSTAGIGALTVAYAGSQPITGVGIDSTLAFGTTTVAGGAIPVLMTGIDSTVAFGTAVVTAPIVNTGPVRFVRPSRCRFRPGARRTKDLIAALVGYYGSLFVEDNVGNNPVTLTSGITPSIGPYGKLPYFDGSIPRRGTGIRSLNFAYNQPFTISLTGNVLDTTSYRCLLACYSSSKGWAIYCAGNSIYFTLYGGVGVYARVHNANYTILSATVPQRITISYSGNGHTSGFKFYQNGILLSGNVSDNDGIGTSDTTTTNFLNVGHQDSSYNHYGVVGDVLVWNRQLTDREIADDYGDPFGPIRPNRLNIAYPYSLTLVVSPSAIDSTSAIGSALFAYAGTQSITATGIGDTLTFGTAATSMGSIPVLMTGIDSTTAFGGASVGLGGQTLIGSGIASTATFGTASVQREVVGTGIDSTAVFGTTLVYLAGTLPVLPSGIDSTLNVGSAVLIPHPYMGPVRHFILPTHPHLNLAHPRSRGLVGAWPYYAMKRIYDLISGNHVDFQNATFGVDVTTSLGKLPYSSSTYGKALKKLDFGPTRPFSIAVSGYVHPSASNVSGIFVSNYYNNAGYSFGLTVSGGASGTTAGPYLYFGADSTHRIRIAAPFTVTKGIAYRYVITYDGSYSAGGVNLYVDGSQLTTSVAQDTLLSTSDTNSVYNLYFNKEGETGNILYGSSGNVIVWNRILTPVEIQEDYDDPFGMFRARRPNLTVQHTPEIIPTSIGSTLAFGSSILTRASLPIVGTGIDSTVAVGSPDVALGILHLVPSAIAPESAVGSPIALGALAPAAIASTLILGTPATGSGLAVPAIEPTTALGYDTLTLGSLAVAVSGIGSTYASGITTIQSAIGPTSIVSMSSVSSSIDVFNTNTASPTGIDSTLTIGSPSVAIQPWSITLTGWGPTGILGSVTVNPFATVAPDSITSGETVDIPLVPLTPFGVGSIAAVGLPRVEQPNNLQPDGIQPTATFGTSAWTQSGTEYVYALGIDSTVSIGDFTTSIQQTLAPSSLYSWYASPIPLIRLIRSISPIGIDSANRFGIAGTASGLLGTGIDSVLTIGIPSVAYSQTIVTTGIGPRAQVGTPVVSSTLIVSVSTIEVVGRYGEPALWRSQTTSISGISSRATAGVPTVAGSAPVSAAGVDPTSDVGAPAVVVGVVTIRTSGIVSSVAVTNPAVTSIPLAIATDGIIPTETLGSISVGYSQVVSIAGIASRTTVGISALSLSATLIAGQIESTFEVSEPVVGTGIQHVHDIVSVTSVAAVGTPGLSQHLDIAATGIASTATVPVPTLQVGVVTLSTSGIRSGVGTGIPVVGSLAIPVAVTGISGTSGIGAAGLALGVYRILGSGIATTTRMVGAGISIVAPDVPALGPESVPSGAAIGTPSAVEYEQCIRVRSIATATAVPEPYVAVGAPGVLPVPAYPTSGVYGATRRILAGAWKTQIRMSGQHVTIQATDGRGKWWDMPGYVNVPSLVAQASAEDVRVNDLAQPTYRWELRFDRPVPLGPSNRVRYTDPTRGSVFIYTGPASDVSGLGVVWSARGDDMTGSTI